jgi:hypothetical protein
MNPLTIFSFLFLSPRNFDPKLSQASVIDAYGLKAL